MTLFPNFRSEKMILTLEVYDKKVTYETSADMTPEELYDHLKSLVVASYFTEDAWNNMIIDHARDLNEMREETRSAAQRQRESLMLKHDELWNENHELKITLQTLNEIISEKEKQLAALQANTFTSAS